jgi:hypothetical protein
LVPCRNLGLRDQHLIIVRIRAPKTRKVFARIQYVTLECPFLVSLLARVLAEMDPGELFWPFSYGLVNTRIETLLHRVQRPGAWTAAGLRAGRATARWLREQEFDRLRRDGRWRSSVTLEHYIQIAVATMAENQISEVDLCRLGDLAAEGPFLAEAWWDRELRRRVLGRNPLVQLAQTIRPDRRLRGALERKRAKQELRRGAGRQGSPSPDRDEVWSDWGEE